MVLPDSRKIPRVPRYLGASPASHLLFVYRTLTVSGALSHALRLNRWFLTRLSVGRPTKGSPATPEEQRLPAITPPWFRLLPVRSPLLGQSWLLSSRPATKMFQFTGCPPDTLCIQVLVTRLLPRAGLPHSEISGSTLDCSSPKRIAACRVLPRPSAPRHPPCALCSLMNSDVL
jgi:hypothetical protein